MPTNCQRSAGRELQNDGTDEAYDKCTNTKATADIVKCPVTDVSPARASTDEISDALTAREITKRHHATRQRPLLQCRENSLAEYGKYSSAGTSRIIHGRQAEASPKQTRQAFGADSGVDISLIRSRSSDELQLESSKQKPGFSR